MQRKTNSLTFFFVVSMPKIMEVEYSRTSRKQPLKMRLSGRLREVVVYKNRTTEGLFQEEVRAHLLYGRRFIARNKSKLHVVIKVLRVIYVAQPSSGR